MARDAGLEAMVNDALRGQPGLITKAMFGGWVWMQHGNLLCGAKTDSLLVRLGKDNVAWALELPGVTAMMSGTRPMRGWVRASAEAYGGGATFDPLIAGALAFVATLPRK
ncbi:hypothetical protein Terro_4392 [Terriglobus roseus DSM 18391]|uniref:TfoX N-terminal domain-containing protein n=1 Tax=Terriglobus roseus (strain DSM 18391 / NRRL B-41598 / KBS 63) TaxID=926566 RepID=I3ZMX1_TERRK|nr:TfoX/Sxy family protein [Terriglobus roseus]AFL90589.1 hypothetical protein Terro_4392 [Terriglobus roseus DSM 18391]